MRHACFSTLCRTVLKEYSLRRDFCASALLVHVCGFAEHCFELWLNFAEADDQRWGTPNQLSTVTPFIYCAYPKAAEVAVAEAYITLRGVCRCHSGYLSLFRFRNCGSFGSSCFV